MNFWKMSIGDLKADKLDYCLNNQIIAIGYGEDSTQGRYFVKEMKIGDIFYLTVGGCSGIKLLGRVISESRDSVYISNWYERNYEIIAENTYNKECLKNDKTRAWKPSFVNTIYPVPEESYVEFEEKLLKPLFNVSIPELFFLHSNANCWWLNAAPSEWKLDEYKLGDEITYTWYNKSNNPRKHKINFINSKIGDFVIGYQTSPGTRILALLQIVEKVENETITFRKVGHMDNPIPYSDFVSLPELQNMQFIVNPNGSLFCLSNSEYEIIFRLILNKNPNLRILYDVNNLLHYTYQKVGNAVTMKFSNPNKFSYNKIYFGAPGTGKSYQINVDKSDLLGCDNDTNYERVTFHPEYTYANFVGTYKPVPTRIDGSFAITYEYVPGPFIRVLVNAIKNPDKPYLLIIEEINRANVAAVFGDVFQLLDRSKSGDSEYPINVSQDLKYYLSESEKIDLADTISIPSNMFIWASMNSADQGVFPMDTAFKRRWDFKYIGIDEKKDEIKNYNLYWNDSGEYVNWNELRCTINEVLLNECNINEDKLMGPFFIPKAILEDKLLFTEAFVNKVIMYLFEDAAKQKKKDIFSGCDESSRNSYSKICGEFRKKGYKIFKKSIVDRIDKQAINS